MFNLSVLHIGHIEELDGRNKDRLLFQCPLSPFTSYIGIAKTEKNNNYILIQLGIMFRSMLSTMSVMQANVGVIGWRKNLGRHTCVNVAYVVTTLYSFVLYYVNFPSILST